MPISSCWITFFSWLGLHFDVIESKQEYHKPGYLNYKWSFSFERALWEADSEGIEGLMLGFRNRLQTQLQFPACSCSRIPRDLPLSEHVLPLFCLFETQALLPLLKTPLRCAVPPLHSHGPSAYMWYKTKTHTVSPSRLRVGPFSSTPHCLEHNMGTFLPE